MMKVLRRALREELPILFATPALLWQLLFLYMPLAVMVAFSFISSTDTGFKFSLTLSHYLRILKPVYLKVILDSFSLAALTAVLCLLFGFPVAYFLSVKVKRWKMVLLLLIILPSWSNFIVLVYAWFFLLDRQGFINQFLTMTGVIQNPFHLLNTFFSILVGMVYCFLPFMILPIYAVLEKMDKRLLEASADLGAGRWSTFTKVVVPLSLPGVYAGLLLVFIPAFGEYVIPSLLGGSRKMYWGNVIVEKFLVVRDWAAGFALAWSGIIFLLLALLLGCFFSMLYKKISTKAKSV